MDFFNPGLPCHDVCGDQEEQAHNCSKTHKKSETFKDILEFRHTKREQKKTKKITKMNLRQAIYGMHVSSMSHSARPTVL